MFPYLRNTNDNLVKESSIIFPGISTRLFLHIPIILEKKIKLIVWILGKIFLVLNHILH